jgi:hypothetical protein
MQVKTPTIIFERDLSKGFIPQDIEQDQKEETLTLLTCLLQIEKNVENLPQGIQDLILKRQLTYSDMFMRNMFRDLKKHNNISKYSEGWFSPVRENFEETVFVQDNSVLGCYKETFVALSIFEFESIPLLRFETASTYVSFMLALYGSDYDALESLFGKSDTKVTRAKSFEKAVEGLSGDAGILVNYFLYRALACLVMENPEFKSQLIQTEGSKIVSNVTFPPNLHAARGQNFYGELLMRLREAIL